MKWSSLASVIEVGLDWHGLVFLLFNGKCKFFFDFGKDMFKNDVFCHFVQLKCLMLDLETRENNLICCLLGSSWSSLVHYQRPQKFIYISYNQ